MESIMIRLFLLIVISTSSIFAASAPYATQMSKKDSSFSLTLNFNTTLSKEKLMEVLFTYEHTKKYVKSRSLSISLIEEKPLCNVMKYHYNYLVSKMDMHISNRITPDYNHFLFEQTSFKRTNKLIPEVISSGGKYDIIKDENGKLTVKYTQWGKMDQKISGIFQKIIEMESVGFIKDLVKYITTLETKTALASASTDKSIN